MNVILFERDELEGNRVVLTDHRAKHIVKVLQSDVGDSIRVGETNGKMGTGKIVTMKKKYPFVVELLVSLFVHPAPPPAIDLLLALPRPIMLKRILSQVTALGVGTIYLVNAARVEKSFWEAGIVTEEEYRPHLLHGLEQAGDTQIPNIHMYKQFRPFVEDYLPDLMADYGSLLLAHPHSVNTLSHCLSGKSGRVLCAVGPEGGWVDFEVGKFLAAGFLSFSMGPRILKVDTAVVSIHGRISQVLGN